MVYINIKFYINLKIDYLFTKKWKRKEFTNNSNMIKYL